MKDSKEDLSLLRHFYLADQLGFNYINSSESHINSYKYIGIISMIIISII